MVTVLRWRTDLELLSVTQQAELSEDTAPQFYACLEAVMSPWTDPSTAAGIAAQPALARLTACFAAQSDCFDGLGDTQQAVQGWATCWRVCGELRTDDTYAFAKVRGTPVLLQLLDSLIVLTTCFQ
jgi:hypothetical protein